MGKCFVLILDGVGIGETPDANKYSDTGSNTLANIAKAVGGLKLPNLGSLGIGNIYPIEGVPSLPNPKGNWGKMVPVSEGKDSISGHWEIMGNIVQNPFPVFPDGFPDELVEKYEKLIARKTLGNEVASGTVIIEKYGKEHMETGYPIIYTSADSVFQIAAHEEIVSLDKLYEFCQIARDMLVGKNRVARVIARPFIGTPGNFTRTKGRKDYAVKPKGKLVFEAIRENGLPVVGVGKIEDLYSGVGVSESIHTASNTEGMKVSLDLVKNRNSGLIMTNLVDFDMKWGHRNLPEDFAKGLVEVDIWLEKVLLSLSDDDLFIITADHGNDPTTPSTDHSREYVPLLVYSKSLKSSVNLGLRKTFADVGASVADWLNVSWDGPGTSVIPQLR